MKVHLVYYDKIPGETVFSLTKNPQSRNILFQVLSYIAQLHHYGINFRALHLSNVLVTPDRQFALIDISDLKMSRRPLSMYRRYRNLSHLLFYKNQDDRWRSLGLQDCLKSYIQASGLTGFQAWLLKFYFKKKIPMK